MLLKVMCSLARTFVIRIPAAIALCVADGRLCHFVIQLSMLCN